jgi:glyoxylase-like metal-dependent hydrolase (beta-lactamase superfamily II)
MSRCPAPLALSLIVTAGVVGVALAADVPKFTIEPLGDRVLALRSGETGMDGLLVLTSARGLVVIDTGISPTLTKVYRAKLEEVLDRKDFIYVINTHFHYDHTDGNQVFPDATVVGNEATRRRMLEWNASRDAFVANQRTRLETWTRQAAQAPPGSEQERQLRDLIANYTPATEDLAGKDFILVPPAITFTDRLSLYLGDMTVTLYPFGPGTHTGDDVIAHVPEVGLVAVGDLFHPAYVQFLFQPGEGVDIDHKIGVLDAILADPDGVKYVVNGHGARLTAADLKARRDYMAAVWRGVQAEAKAGGTLAGARARLPLDGELAYLKRLGIPEDQLMRQHQATVALAWLVANGGEDAAAAIERVVRAQGADAARASFKQILPQRDDRYLVDERSLNALGYRLLGEGRTGDAIAVFEMNVEAFPESWNVYDSLAEGLMTAGENERAIELYRKSLQLNPQNSNAVTMLQRLQAP